MLGADQKYRYNENPLYVQLRKDWSWSIFASAVCYTYYTYASPFSIEQRRPPPLLSQKHLWQPQKGPQASSSSRPPLLTGRDRDFRNGLINASSRQWERERDKKNNRGTCHVRVSVVDNFGAGGIAKGGSISLQTPILIVNYCVRWPSYIRAIFDQLRTAEQKHVDMELQCAAIISIRFRRVLIRSHSQSAIQKLLVWCGPPPLALSEAF